MMSERRISPTIEEYLEQIYRLEREDGVARTKRLAEMVGVSLGTVTNTIDALKNKQLVVHKPYKGVTLTDTGRKIALKVLRRHRLSERLLTDFLNVDWSKVHDYACRLEHGITDNLTEPLEQALDYPLTCPHGNPIPTLSGDIREDEAHLLLNCDEGDERIVVKIVQEKQDLLEYLLTMHLVPGTQIEVVKKAPFEGPITVKIGGQIHPISHKIASIVWVK